MYFNTKFDFIQKWNLSKDQPGGSSPSQERIVGTPADTAGGEEEPVHEDAGTVVVRIVGQQSVPLVLLLTGTVSVTPQSGGGTDDYKWKIKSKTKVPTYEQISW